MGFGFIFSKPGFGIGILLPTPGLKDLLPVEKG